MSKEKQVRKVQVSLPIEQYPEIEERWTSLGFKSVAEAGRFLLMDKVNEFYKDTKKSQRAILRLEKLKQQNKTDSTSTAPVQTKPYQHNRMHQNKEPKIEYIAKESDEYTRLIESFKERKAKFTIPNDIKGITRQVNDKGTKVYGWWLNDGSK
ncbi:hypothetical protein HCA93_03280 [Listeria innocua]|uniref:hypothetical protein n=1 Tax=Listeria innocua TaxID=1642 RepID=UPI0016236B77|nr:hypothetical protein [Listeria innocua]MBC2135331.1 hypothetical protein [Listeria innocua]